MAIATATPAARPQDAATVAPKTGTHRVTTMDVVRGIVMILMAIDHVRVFSGVPAGGPTPGVFFTRWITHFVAPAFIFLAGTAAFLHGQRLADKNRLARFLFTRGVWLLLLELTVIRIAWTFNFDFANYLLAGVIWVIGWCMILLAPFIYLPIQVTAALGLAIIFGHNLMDVFAQPSGPPTPGSGPGWLFKLVYGGGAIRIGGSGPPLVVLYTIVPWIGVMAAGYAFGPVMRFAPERRRVWSLRLGMAAIAAFLLLRTVDSYGDRNHWRAPRQQDAPVARANAAPANAPNAGATAPRRPQMPHALAFLATSKYPASLQFLLMTLGPMLIALALFEGVQNRATRVLAVFGRVPLFYYLLHVPLIHAAACVVSLLRTGAIDPWLFMNHPVMVPPAPEGYTWSLALLYLVTAVVVWMLYFPCRWLARLKERRRDTWLSYL